VDAAAALASSASWTGGIAEARSVTAERPDGGGDGYEAHVGSEPRVSDPIEGAVLQRVSIRSKQGERLVFLFYPWGVEANDPPVVEANGVVRAIPMARR
jgi:hypothetical protein